MKLIISCLFILIAIVLNSCTKVIELKLKGSEIKYVIEGVITNEPGTCKVQLSKTKNFNEDNVFNGVSGAIVKIKDNGIEIPLSESQPGSYETNRINGTPGHTYQLSVSISGQHFTASCIMPQPVLMDTLYTSRGPLGQFKFATLSYTDPIATKNGYRFIQYVNGVKEPAIFWEDDEFTNGQLITMQLDVSADDEKDPRNIKTGDVVTVEMLCVDDPIVKYWYTLATGGGDGEGETAAPANPLTNIQGGALGYFSAHTVSRKTVIAK